MNQRSGMHLVGVVISVLLALFALSCARAATPTPSRPAPAAPVAPAAAPTPAPTPTPAPVQPEFRLKFVGTNRTFPQFQLMQWWGDELTKRTNGRVVVEYTSLPELGLTGFEMVRVMRAGLVDVADVLPGYVSGDLPLLEGADIAGLFHSYDTYQPAFQAWLKVLKENEEKMGGKFIGAHAWSNQYLFSRKPIRDLSDLKGMKVRIWFTSLADYLRALGAEPVTIPFAEVYTAMERGTVDGVVTGSDAGYNAKLYEVSKYLVDIGVGPKMTAVVISKKTWDKLPPDVRKVIEDLEPELIRRGFQMGRETTETGIKGNIEKGMEFIPAKPEWYATFKEIVEKQVVPAWVKRAGADGKKAFNNVLGPLVGYTIP
ncbi:MAG: TRAP transporter substrate-binding protein [Dehalococcoidia bacterium]|nr:TRAP transporter substrate-binding protein [Dehalococcoidia bacterium]MDW8120275.1 TRAP transporter substrate-binding protein [Chloroflexota bacterium]